MVDVAQLETPDELGTEPGQVAARWISELEAAEKDPDYQGWQRRSRKIIKIYKDAQRSDRSKSKKFALFWSNIETLKPAVYARTPTAVVGRRWRDADPVGRVASEILERALNYSVDSYAFDDVMKAVRDDDLLLARGNAWTRYIPTINQKARGDDEAADPDPDGQTTDDAVQGEEVTWEEVKADHVNWEDFLHSPAREWSEVRWVARRCFLTRDELKDRFGERGQECPLDWSPKGYEEGDKDEKFKKAAVYEIWDKASKTAIWICKSYSQAPLDEKDDPLKLDGFFPCPKPVFGTLGPDSLIPVPDYVFYQDQVEEIDELSQRIHMLIESMKVRGFYAAHQSEDLNNLMRSDDNILIPVDSWAALKEDGGVKGLIEWFPIDLIVSTLTACFEARKQVIDDVYQLTGISDIMRGDTDADETATAQGIKATWGSSRVRERQKELARFARDVLRLKAEIISNNFDPPTLSAMTNITLLTNDEKAQIQQQIQLAQQRAQQQAQALQAQHQASVQQAQAAGQPAPPPPPGSNGPPQAPPVPPDQMKLMDQPSWEDVLGLLRNKALRSFRIDIETDSTVEPNDQEEKQRRIEFIQAVGEYLAKSLPVVQAAPFMIPIITEGLKFLVRGFRVGREMEDVIDRAMDQLQNQPPQQQQPPDKPGPNPQAEMMTAQARMVSAQAQQGRNQVEMAKAQSQHQVDMADIQMEQQKAGLQYRADMHETNTGAQVDMHSAALDQQTQMQQAVEKANERRLISEINSTKPMRAPTP